MNPVTKKQFLLQLLKLQSRLKAATGQGFTLIELLVVIVILGVLGGVGYGVYVAQLARANEGAASTAATAMAKSCAALRVTGDEDQWAAGVDEARVVLNSGSCPEDNSAQTYSVTAGEGGNARTCTAQINANGAVIPGACTP